jgi:ribosome-associated toxin RatA of RatAB toxin-antitoxin module
MGIIHASHTVEIDAPRDRVYEVAADVPGAVAWNPATEKVDVIERDREGRAELVDVEADAMVKKSKSTLRFSYDPPSGLSWTQEKGEVKSLDGRWELTELDPNRTQASYILDFDPGRMLGMLLRGPVEGKVKEFLTKGAAEGLKNHVEGQSD